MALLPDDTPLFHKMEQISPSVLRHEPQQTMAACERSESGATSLCLHQGILSVPNRPGPGLAFTFPVSMRPGWAPRPLTCSRYHRNTP